jgi:serine protease Do
MRIHQALLAACLAAGLGVPAVSAQNKVALGGVTSFLGVGIQEINAERAKALQLREEAGVEITRVDPDSPAERAGLKSGDAVLQYNGQRVEGIAQFSRMVRETPAGRQARLDIVRGGSPQTVTVTVGSRRGPVIFADDGNLTIDSPKFDVRIPEIRIPEIRIPDVPRSVMAWRSSTLGIEAESLNGQLADYFGVKEGVLVRSVVSASAAEKAGIKAGDVITQVNNSRVATPSDITSRVRSLSGQSVPVQLLRERKEVTLTVMFPEAALPAPRARTVSGREQ